MKSSAEKVRYPFGDTEAEFLNITNYFIFENLETFQKCPNLHVNNDLLYFLYTS
tara:strand:- start:1908 stop:2069 length:162 start_codon:yes stop_codon:yes gene_type:complete